MTFPPDRTPKCAPEHRLHVTAGVAAPASPARREPPTDDNGAYVFSMHTLEPEDRS